MLYDLYIKIYKNTKPTINLYLWHLECKYLTMEHSSGHAGEENFRPFV